MITSCYRHCAARCVALFLSSSLYLIIVSIAYFLITTCKWINPNDIICNLLHQIASIGKHIIITYIIITTLYDVAKEFPKYIFKIKYVWIYFSYKIKVEFCSIWLNDIIFINEIIFFAQDDKKIFRKLKLWLLTHYV